MKIKISVVTTVVVSLLLSYSVSVKGYFHPFPRLIVKKETKQYLISFNVFIYLLFTSHGTIAYIGDPNTGHQNTGIILKLDFLGYSFQIMDFASYSMSILSGFWIAMYKLPPFWFYPFFWKQDTSGIWNPTVHYSQPLL